MNGIALPLESLTQDADIATDHMLYRDNITWSKGRLRRAKVMSMIVGNKQPSRKKLFSEVQNSEDIQIWSIDVHGKSIYCAKVFNPAVLTKPDSKTWAELARVQRIEIEDPESTLTVIPKQLITDLRHLESLSVTWTKIKSLPSNLFQLRLNSLYLQRNHIKTLNGIEKASQLTILDVSNNHLESLPKTFGQLRSLVTLKLSGNGIHELPESIGQLSQLKTLDCSCNKLKALPNSLGNIIELTSLDVSSNHLTSLPVSIGSLPNLEDLMVRSNQLASLPDSFGQLNRLSSLLLRNNKFTDVPQQLSCLSNLQNLNMRENMITHVDRAILSLKYLILDNNNLKQIDVGIVQCTNLQYLSLKSNELVDVTGVSRLANIRSLNLSDNAIADVPVGLETLAHLHHLNLSSTKIQTVPLVVASMPSLKTLELDECSELDPYLNLAYKNKGIRGVIEHLNEKSPAQRAESQFPSGSCLRKDSDDTAVLRNINAIQSIMPAMPDTTPALQAEADKGLQGVTEHPSDKSPTETAELVFSSDNCSQTASEGTSVLRNISARQSIMPDLSDISPASEAESDNGASAKLVHVARESLVPAQRPPKPPKPSKPSNLATHREADYPLASANESTAPASHRRSVKTTSQLEPIAQSQSVTNDVDTTSRSRPTAETRHPENQRTQQRQSSQDDGQTETQQDAAVIDKKCAELNPSDAGNTSGAVTPGAPVPKPRPPVKKRPPRIVT